VANTVYQHKRTATSGKLPNTTNSSNTAYIAAGQLALNLTDQTTVSSDGTNLFYVGANVPSISVGGVFVANATVVNLGSSNVAANGAVGSVGQVLTSNGSASYWAAAAGGGGVNTANQYTFTNTETFSSNVVMGNVSVNTTLGYATFSVGNSGGNSVVNAYGLTVANATVSSVLSLTGLTTTSNTLSLGTSSIAANGYTYLPNQLLLQWGSLLVNSSTAAQTWPTAFATNAYSITATANTISTNVAVTTCNVSKFTVVTATTANVRVFWTAMGQ
jgi:hypothetical protein